jgi:hypothetical protein
MESSDIEKDEKKQIYATATIIVDGNSTGGEPVTVATTINGLDSNSRCAASVVSIEPSVLRLATEGEPDDPDERKTDLCCGFCCDVLRASIIVNIISLVGVAIWLLLVWWGLAVINSYDMTTVEDDQLFEELNELENYVITTEVILYISVMCLSVIFALVGIIGASKFNKYLVLATGVWYIIDCIYFLSVGWFGHAFGVAAYSYPHIALYLALRSGTISRQNYMRERYCCCDSEPN